PITSGVWHHAAATYDGTTWKLYLDGNLEASLAVGQPAAFDSIQHAAIGAALDSTGTAAGGFLGALDEVRIWNVARSGGEIAGTMGSTIPSATGLVARFGMDQGSGTTLTSGAISGTLTNGPSWVEGTALTSNALPVVTIDTPASGIVVNPGDGLDFIATAADTDGSVTKVEFFDGSTKIAEGSAPPYNQEWVATGYGIHNFTAHATDNQGATGISATVTVAVRPPGGSGALYFDGVNDGVGFGDPADLKLSTFTLETWVRRESGGASATTGAGGVSGIPLIAKGRGENDNDTLNCNYFLGISPLTGTLVADFEEGPGGTAPGLNHPITGNVPLTLNEWHHVAATYDGTSWKLYLDGALDASLTVGQPAASNSIQHASLGSALNSLGAPEGYLHDFLDETRIWNSARSITQIQSTMNSEVPASAGLVGRWPMTEGSGTTLASTAGPSIDGTLTNGPLWTSVIGDLTNDIPPTLTLVSPASDSVNQPLNLNLKATVNDVDSSNLTVTMHARPTSTALSGSDFTIVALPDTQYYSGELNGGTKAIYSAQTDWIVSEMNPRNIQFVMHLGDVVDHGDNNNGGLDNEWEYLNAKEAMDRLENPLTTLLPNGLPYSMAIGNHDQSPNGNPEGTSKYWNKYFGVHPTLGTNHFDGKPYYGGTQVPQNADNNFTLFSGGGLDFICISFEYDTSPDAADLAWADALLKAHPSRRGIITTHWTVNTGNPATFSTQGSAIYQALKNNPNLMMMHGGHIHGEGRRTDSYAGRTVHSLLADFQSDPHGGDGWLRIMQFSPANNVVHVKTYSPTLNQFQTDANSQFDLTMDLQSGLGPFVVVGTQTNVAPGSTVSLPTATLNPGTRYEWYATVSDANTSIQSATQSFTTGGVHYPPTVAITSPVNGAYFGDSATIELTAAASDADGTVSKVQFYSGSTLIGETTASPYTLTWSNVAAGTYTVVAKATDDENQVTTSEPISVQVLAEPAAPSLANRSVGLFNSGWVVAATSPAPHQFDQPGTDVGDIELKINGSGVPFANGLTLASNWNNSANASITSEDNIVAPYANGSGNTLVSVIDNSNNNAAGSNPCTIEQSAGTAVAFLPYRDGWTGASIGLNGNFISGNLPASVIVAKSGSGLYTISGLSLAGNLLAFANGD
ncbi:metallophosphoesterase, partial [bacterium]|nr:metallophosphoesterase [bacterium]